MKKKCRCKKCVKFRKKYPFEYLDIYGFYLNIAEFLAPRLKAFKKHNFSHPIGLTPKKWDKVLDKIIKAFELIAKDEREKEKYKEVEEGIKLFTEYYFDLWI